MTILTSFSARFAASAMIFALAACSASQSPAPSVGQAQTNEVRINSAEGVKDCTFLGFLAASRYSGLLFAGNGLKKAREEAIKDAKALGATDLVFTQSNTGVVQTVEGNAYRCPS
ncbi:MAG: hypothetical protein ABJ263_02420 [Tateyamaria sp.]|uniref:hypothetical protein n=1 Tax=Tateyamaria sp. TaxID=1929288 RepID=UPI003294F0EE